MDVELQATCSALGYLEGTEYVKEPDCLETVKDLIRFLRRDTDICDIRRQLGNAQILQNDLVPIVKAYHEDKDLFDTVIKLLVNLTQPVISCFNNEIPDEKTLRNNCLEVEGYLQDYKEAFIDEELFSILATKIQTILKMEWDERREEDKLQLERLFMLLRNILLVPADVNREQRTEDDASTHDQVLWVMHSSGLEDLILYVASSDRERSHLCMHVMEIIALIFKEQEPETLASAGVQRSLTEKEKDQRELEQAREREKVQKKANILKFSGRHSRFGGTFILKNIKSISENDVIYHKPLCEVKRFSYDEGKNRKKISKNRAPIKTDDPKRRSTLSMRLSLKEFCIQFLINAYNPLMRAVKDALTRKSTQDNDETFYLWAMRFFMEFCRLHCHRVDFVSETMSMSAFHYIYTQLCTYYESVRLGKGEECKVWGRRSHLALKAYQELLRTLDFMSRSEEEMIRESAKVIQSNVFYMMEYRDVFVTLLKNFKESQCSRAYLRDLVESTHIFLKMLETFTKKNKNLVVQKKKKKRNKKKNKTAAAEPMAEPTQDELETIWSENISDQVTACLQGREEVPENMTPFDAASEMDMDQQRVEAMLKIQSSLRDGRSGEAIALFRAAREVWPEGEEFGSADMGEEDEFMALREIFMAALPRPQQSQPVEEDEGEEEENEVGEEEMGGMEASESQFDFTGFISDFAHINVLKSYSILLREFSDNSDSVNHCVVKMLHRLSHDLGFVGMLFQASIFKSFSALLNGPYARLPRFKELAKFATFVVRQFTSVAKINKKIFVDMLFWKTKNEALAVTGGYDFSAKSKAKSLWTEHQEEELIGLFEKFRDVAHPELDTADLILGELTSNHTRMQVIKELKRQGLIHSAADLKRKGRGRAWTEQEIQELKDAYDLHKDSNFPISDIMSALTGERGRVAVTSKIMELGLVTNKAELNKKRKGGGRRKKGRESDDDGEDSEGERLFPDSTGGKRRQRDQSSDSSSSEGSSDDDSGDDDNENDEGDDDADADHAVGDRVRQAASSVGDYVSKLVEQGYQEQIEWMVRNLRNSAEDREEGVCIPTPIVPLSEENETAMEDESFLVFLRAIGITPPANQQELFWRIPAQFSPADLTTMADGLEVTGSGQAANPDEVQRIVSRILPNLLSSVSSADQGKNKNLAAEKRKKKEEKQRKRLERQKEKEKKKKKVKAKKGDKLARFVKSDEAGDQDQMSEEENDQERFVPVVAHIAHGSDTSDSGLDSELEVKEQRKMWLEKKSEKRMSAAERKEALHRMMARRNQKRNRTTGGQEESGTSTVTAKTSGRNKQDAREDVTENDDGPVAVFDDEDISDNVNKLNKASASPSKSATKKRRVQQLESDSDSDTSSLSSLSEAPAGDEEMDEDTESSQRTKAKVSSAKKRALDSDSDSDVPLAMGNRKRQKNNSDLDLSQDTSSVAMATDKAESSDKENKETDSQSQLDESLRLHFSTSDEEDNGGDKDNDGGNDGQGEKDKNAENYKEETPKESFPATMLTQGLDSDDDEDDHITLKAAVKRRRAAVIDSDEDE